MKNLTTIGIDLSKHSFQIHGTNKKGKIVMQKKVSRKQLSVYMANIPKCLVGIEACATAHYWARKFTTMGHDVKIMSPQYVKPYVKSNKNDRNDAAAICEAVTRPSMRFVPVKTVEQLDMQAIHRVRSRLIAQRTQLSNQLRAFLAEYGVIIPKGAAAIKQIFHHIENSDNELTQKMRKLCLELYEEYLAIQKRIDNYDKYLITESETNALCKKIDTIPGIGHLTATAFVSALGKGHVFKKGKEVSGWLGLTPRQYSSGSREFLGKISKRGDTYLRTLLIHGARSVIRAATNKSDPYHKWVLSLKDRIGMKKTCIAVANKNTRIAWALIVHDSDYDPYIAANMQYQRA